MPNSEGPISAAAVVILRLFPRTIRSAVLNHRQFVERFAIASDAAIQLQERELAFQRSKLLSSVRRWLSNPDVPQVLVSVDGREWTLAAGETRSGAPIVVRGDVRFGLPDFSPLHPDGDVRLRWFDAECNTFELTDQAVGLWREVLAARPASDEEVYQMFEEFRLTPLYVDGAIANHLTGTSVGTVQTGTARHPVLRTAGGCRRFEY